MKPRPILMTAESVRAILNGSKTVTRRVVKPQFGTLWGQGVRHGEDCYSVHVDIQDAAGNWRWVRCPYGKAGDRLWVKEAWKIYTAGSGRDDAGIHYRADSYVTPVTLPPEYIGRYPLSPDGWRSPIYMPRWASRITLVITAVRVERLWNMSHDDALAEGIRWSPGQRSDPLIDYACLWDSINAKRGYPWASSPWVWVVEFRRVTP